MKIKLAAAALLLLGFFLAKQYWRNFLPVTETLPAGRVESASQPTSPHDVQFQAAYDRGLLALANLDNPTGTTTVVQEQTPWPVSGPPYPKPGALLPFSRIVAYYGNLYSRGMGALGEYPKEIMQKKLLAEVEKWREADPTTAVVPALHYIAVVAQAGPGKDGKYRARMPDKEIEKVLAMAEEINGVVFLDVQVGLSTLEDELPRLEKYLKLPGVHLGLDPEFAMHAGNKPGKAIGWLDAKDVNYAAEFLAKLCRDHGLPPKILVIHRFTRPMLKNTALIAPLPEVQIVINMDGFGSPASKLNTYKQYIAKEPVQFAGFKIFYKNDSSRGGLISPDRLLQLSPIPIYIQYQ